MLSRREFLKGSAAAAVYPLLGSCAEPLRWERDTYRRSANSRVAILGARSYDEPLKDTILRGIKLFQLDLKGKVIVLKPNLVEFDPNGVINTTPLVVEAALEAFKSMGGRDVSV